MADFYAARAGTNAGAPLDGFLTAVHTYFKGETCPGNSGAVSPPKELTFGLQLGNGLCAGAKGAWIEVRVFAIYAKTPR